jgi:capping protein alpha
VVQDGDSSKSLIVKTFAERVDSVNLYAGSWVAQWNIEISGDDQAQVGGQVRIQSFCFEEGNIQLLSSRDFEGVSVTASEKVPLAKAIVEQINTFELELLSALGEVFDQIGDQLKSIRRVLPITRTKMEWNVRAHRMVNTLSHAAPK